MHMIDVYVNDGYPMVDKPWIDCDFMIFHLLHEFNFLISILSSPGLIDYIYVGNYIDKFYDFM